VNTVKVRIAEPIKAFFTADQPAKLANIPVIPEGKILPMNICMKMRLFYPVKAMWPGPGSHWLFNSKGKYVG